MRKRILSVLLAATFLATLLAGCSSSSSSDATEGTTTEAAADTSDTSAEAEAESTSAEASGDVVTITYWGWDSDYYQPMMEAYEALHSEVHFEPTAVEWGDMLTRAQQALASGSALPTIIAMDNTLIENWKQMDIFVDLRDYGFDNSQYVDNLAEKVVKEDGSVIGVESSINPAAIAYKRDLALEYFGTDDPDELFDMFSSYDDYVTRGAEIYDQTDGTVYLFHSGQAVAEWLYFASDVQNMDGDTLNYTSKMTDVMSKLIALRDANAVDTYQSGTPEANATYADDIHIFYPTPNWGLNYYIKGNDPDGSGNWGLMHAPVDYNHGGSAHGITSSATDEEKQAAYDFLTWVHEDPDGAATLRDECNFITPYKEFVEDPDFVGASEGDIEWFGGEDIGELYYLEVAPNMSPIPSTVWDNTMVNVRNDVAQQVVDNKDMTLDEAIEIGREAIEQLVTDDSVTIE